MDSQMKINGETVRALRERKSWSQEHLANASGLSARTVQRVEMDGLGSAETRLALAAALDVPVASLLVEVQSSVLPVSGSPRLPLWGWLGWGIGIVFSIVAIGYGYREGAFPLDQIAANLFPAIAFFGICAGVISMFATRLPKRRD